MNPCLPRRQVLRTTSGERKCHKAGNQQRACQQTLGENVDEHSIDFLDRSSTFSPLLLPAYLLGFRDLRLSMIKGNKDGMAMAMTQCRPNGSNCSEKRNILTAGREIHFRQTPDSALLLIAARKRPKTAHKPEGHQFKSDPRNHKGSSA
jgi:hypothetical protein